MFDICRQINCENITMKPEVWNSREIFIAAD